MSEAVQWKVNREGWDAGPWDEEPDRVEFEHAGLPCLMVRHPFGHWCGYAAVFASHPWHGKDHSDVDVEGHGGRIEVHGKLNYSGACFGVVCHTPKPGEPDNVWWFGFDAGHPRDQSPGLDAIDRRLRGCAPHFFPHRESRWEAEVYRDMAYVRREVERLAEQLASIGEIAQGANRG